MHDWAVADMSAGGLGDHHHSSRHDRSRYEDTLQRSVSVKPLPRPGYESTIERPNKGIAKACENERLAGFGVF
jgi:hypothetical protein